jgi:organic hydroperoxide reductase OsmC/OhrA
MLRCFELPTCLFLCSVLNVYLKPQYTAHATAKGLGRNGTVESDGLKLNLAMPKELGGTGKGENPEQLFAMGYACQ